jgi:hypothetical protein
MSVTRIDIVRATSIMGIVSEASTDIVCVTSMGIVSVISMDIVSVTIALCVFDKYIHIL